jgi:hypothetical protein
MKKGMIAFVGMVIGLVLLVVGFLGPWYIISANGGSGTLNMNYNIGLYLTRMEVKGTMGTQDISLSMSYVEIENNIQTTAGVNTESFAVINTAMYITIFAIVIGFLAVIGMAAFVFHKGKPKMMKLFGGVFGILTFILALVPALYFWSTSFSQNSTGFWSSQDIMGITMTGGPGYAWYLMIVAAIITLIVAVAILLKKIETEPVKTEVVTPPAN